MNYLKSNLIFLRKVNDLTQQKLADDIGISQKTIGTWESVRKLEPQLRHLKLLSAYYSVSIYWMVRKDLRTIAPMNWIENYLEIQNYLKNETTDKNTTSCKPKG